MMSAGENAETLPFKEAQKKIALELVEGLGFHTSQEYFLQRKLTWRYVLNMCYDTANRSTYCSIIIICSPQFKNGAMKAKIMFSDINNASKTIIGLNRNQTLRIEFSENDRLIISGRKVVFLLPGTGTTNGVVRMNIDVHWGCNFSLRNETNPADMSPIDPEYVTKKLLDCISTPRLTDMVFVVGEEEVPAHRAILAAMSDVFMSMFSLDTTEMRTGRVVVTDATAAGMKRMVRCLYTSWEPEWDGVGDEDLLELAYLAHKYGLEPLLEHCKRRMVETLRVENVCLMLKAARTLSLQCVIDPIHNLLKDNRTVFQSEQWKSMEEDHPRVAIEVYRMILGLS